MPFPEPDRITVAVHPPYEVVIGPGASREVVPWLRVAKPARCALVTDENVARLHARRLKETLADAGLEAHDIVIPAGEAHKTRATKEKVEDALAELRIGRDGAILALGGGMVGDVAGFAAATWNRGIRYVQIPTTLLAMVDASVGGKTGVDHPAGKNLIGAFHHPAAVFADLDHLATLPERELRSGLAEAVKCGVIRDQGLFDRIRRRAARLTAGDQEELLGVIVDCVRIKADVVGADERESDLRRTLNFGHTIGHALEAIAGYTVPHGETVAIGMVAEARIAVRLSLLREDDARAIETLLRLLKLPTALPPWAADTARILDAARRDKKARAGRLVCALPSSIGRMAAGAEGYGIMVEEPIAAEVLSGMLVSA